MGWPAAAIAGMTAGIGAAGSMGTSFLGASYGQVTSKRAADVAWQRYGQRYQAQVADLKAAGLNPILAASGGFGSGGSVPQAQGFAPSGVNIDLASTAHELAQASKAEQDVKESKTRAVLNLQKVKESTANVFKIRAEANLASQKERNLVEEVNEIANRIYVGTEKVRKMQAEIRNLDANTSLQQRELKVLEDKRLNVQKDTQHLIESIKILRLKQSELEAIAKVYKGNKGYVMKFVHEFMRSLNVHIGLSNINVGR